MRDNCETLARINHYLEVYYLSNDQYNQKFKALDLSETDQM